VSEIEELAERVLADVPDWIWDGETLPVPVEHIADSCFGVLVRDVEDLAGISGLLFPAVGEIWVNAAESRDWPPRRRFTIGHELGHWCMHRSGGAIWCRAHAVDPENGTRRAYPPEESEANEFAAALLMPAALVRRHYERLRRRDPDGCFQQLCRIFGTSGAAMSRRLRDAL
jgi:Zn-dependent peptidase ImmA (M78 family)